MPQLMPFNWVLSVFMIMFIFMTLCFIYYIKDNESFSIGMLNFNSLFLYNSNNNYLW